MKAAIVPFAFAVLTACNQAQEPIVVEQKADGNTVEPAAVPTAKPFTFEDKDELVELHFAWSAESAAIPQLVSRFQAQLNRDKADLTANARQDKTFRDKEGYPFHSYTASTDYKTAGQSPRLLSLSVDAGSYTGGAHGNYGTHGLLWDRREARELDVAGLFANPANRDRLLTERWCNALNRAREVKRGAPVEGDGMFDDCPKLDEIAIVPTDKDGNGRFERLVLTASPYVAGPYAEGDYQIDLPVTADLIAVLKSDYRESFEPGQPQ